MGEYQYFLLLVFLLFHLKVCSLANDQEDLWERIEFNYVIMFCWRKRMKVKIVRVRIPLTTFNLKSVFEKHFQSKKLFLEENKAFRNI